jgi:hypothetical protein
MNKILSAVPVAAIAVLALAGCTKNTAAGVAASHSAQASVAAADAKTAASNAVSKCLPKSQQTEANLVAIATSIPKRDALGKCLDIPKANRHAFAVALLDSSYNAYQKGDFKTRAGRAEWAEDVLPVVVETYQAK